MNNQVKLGRNHIPVFDPEGHGLEVRLGVVAGEVNEDLIVADDEGGGAVPRHDGVLVDDFTVVHLDCDSNTNMFSSDENMSASLKVLLYSPVTFASLHHSSYSVKLQLRSKCNNFMK